ncbi:MULTISPECIES: hypothetical protein [unclassified Haladaptatus]|uniref:DUF7471 family protein n=2 Tax=Haladaptatus TaxID=367188 RepID=UPI00209C1005|nr:MULTISPECIES: hypothetical protein [unclassified Haladaptatus]MCO8244350.1 hypothetical protein [Haladaptatus sp. AB643]MCO8254027.1 hypothetical protein [Haladaptatus sp. AB618]
MVPLYPLHVVTQGGSVALHVVLAVAGLGSAAIFLLALAAFRQRRSLPYLLIALAFAALAGRELVGGLTMANYLTANAHHLFEHGLDIVMMLLLIGAVYYARTVEKRKYDD